MIGVNVKALHKGSAIFRPRDFATELSDPASAEFTQLEFIYNNNHYLVIGIQFFLDTAVGEVYTGMCITQSTCCLFDTEGHHGKRSKPEAGAA